jgi:hypothetical protein
MHRDIRILNGIIAVGAIWVYPFLSYFILKFTKNRIPLRYKILKWTFIASILAVFGFLIEISFTLSTLNWFLFSTIYLSICHLLNITQFQSNKVIKIFGSIVSFFIYGLGFTIGSVGILGIGFIIGDVDIDEDIWLNNGLIYKQFNIGNALSDNRGTRVEINKTISFFPLIEWKKQEKMYWGVTTYENPINVRYDESKRKIFLSKIVQNTDSLNTVWKDSLKID